MPPAIPGSTKLDSNPSTELPAGIAEQENASAVEWAMFTWVTPLLDRGLTRLKDGEMMTQSDLLNLPPYEDPARNARILQEHWDAEVAAFWERVREYEAKHGPIDPNPNKKETTNNAPDSSPSADTEMTSPASPNGPPAAEGDEEVWPVETPSLSRALRHAFWGRIAVGGVCLLFSDGSSFAFPFLLREFIKWMSEPDPEVWVGFMWVIGIVGTNLVKSFCLNAAALHTGIGFTRMTTALPILIYDKALTLTPDHGMTGHLTTLHASDSQRFFILSLMFHDSWISPLLLIGAAIALYFFLGVAGIIAIVVLVVTSPIQAVLMGKLMGFRQQLMAVQDRRLAAVNEALQGIRIAKFMCWEQRFEERIRSIRNEEVAVMQSWQISMNVMWFVAGLIPAVTQIGMFILFYYLKDDFDTARVIPAISMLNVIRIPVLLMPMSFATLVDTAVSTARIQKFLMKPEIKEYVQTDGEPGMMSMDHITVVPPLVGDVPIIRDISCEVRSGDFTIIHGPTGCGKSTLVKVLIGEARLAPGSGAVRCSGSVAYISQEAWIMNATVRSNILMGLPFDEDMYERVVDACQLRDDFKQLPHGDQTEIGERGVNLSGGQKQRVAFARAAYSNRDIVIMDDPLSAVDAHVSRALMEECILKLMAGKTRLLVTHQIQYLCFCQHVIEMGDRCINFMGEPPIELVEAAKAAQAQALEEEEVRKRSEQERLKQEALDRGDIGPDTDEAGASGGAAAGVIALAPDAGTDISGPKTSADTKLMVKEATVVGGVSFEVYLWYMRLGTIKFAIATLMLGAIWRSSSVFGDLWLSWWSGRVRIFDRSYEQTEYMTYFSICVGASVFLNVFWQLVLAFFALNVSRNSHHAMVHRVLRAPTSFFDTTPMGRILNRFSRDMENVDMSISDCLRQILNMVFTLLGTVAVVVYTSPFILIVVPFLLLMLRAVYRRYVATMRNLKQLESTTRSPMMAVLNETLGGLSTIRAYAMSGHFRTMHVVRAQVAAVPPYCVRCCQRWLSVHTEAIGNMALFTVVYMGALIITIGDGGLGITVPVISLAISYVTATTGALTYLSRTIAEFEASMSSTERIMEYSTTIPVERDVIYRKENDDGNPEAPPASWPLSGEIVMKDVQLKYRPELDLVLKGVSFTIAGGSKVGIVGRTGSGKSTIILSIFRMVELFGGSISIDGFDIANVSLKDLRNRITIIPQEPVLFTGSLRSNVDPFGDHTDDVIWDVLAKCRMKDRVEDGGGLDSAVEERGGNFSVGQRQLLCLARAMLKRCKVLLLDEATASVDYEVDALIQHTIRTEFKDCTVITIAHRLETIIDADKVIVMSNGTVEEFGSPATLLNGSVRSASETGIDIVSGAFAGMVRALGDVKCEALKARANLTGVAH